MNKKKLIIYLALILCLLFSCAKDEGSGDETLSLSQEETETLVSSAVEIYEKNRIEERPLISVVGDNDEPYYLQFVYLEEEGGYVLESAPYYVGELYIPDEVNGIDVVAIADYAFVGNESITSVGLLPDTIRKIGKKAFCDCTSLSGNLVLPSSLEEIGEYAFSNTSLTGDLFLPSGLRYVGEGAFLRSDFDGELVIGEALEKIEKLTFANTSLRGDLAIPSNVKSIGERAFYATAFSSLMLTEGLESIGEEAFASMSYLKGDIFIPQSVSDIASSAFKYSYGLDGSYIITASGFYSVSI